MFPLENRPGLISLLAGKPNAETFPITSLQFTMRDPAAGEDVKMELTPDELQHGLQYTPTNGLPELREWVLGLQAFQHNRYQGEGWTVSVGAGSQDLIFKVEYKQSAILRAFSFMCGLGCKCLVKSRRCCARGSTCLRVRVQMQPSTSALTPY